MSDETDPMLGSPDEQARYKEKVMDLVKQTVDEVRAQRREKIERGETPPILGVTGFGGGIGAV
jgi:hypothetical protein